MTKEFVGQSGTGTTFISGGKAISVELFLPPTRGLHPAVVVAYGTEGMGIFNGRDIGAAIRDFASYLAHQGFVTLIPHFFERTGTQQGFETVLPVYDTHRDEWLGALGGCLDFAASQTSQVAKDRLGLVGFSLGGHLSLRRASSGTAPAVRAVVDFYAPISNSPFNGLGNRLEGLPPVQIHHGTSDQTVLITQSDELERLLVGAGKRKGVDYERHDYLGEGHGFRHADSIKLSKERTAGFLHRLLD